MVCRSCKNASLSFTIISTIAAATRLTINKIRTKFFIKVSLKQNNVGNLYGDWKITSRWQKLKLLCADLTNLDLNCNDFFLINGGTHSNSFLGARVYAFLSMKIYSKFF